MNGKVKDFVIKGIATLLVALFAVAAFKYLFPVLLPFGIAYLLSALIRPLSDILSKRTKIPKKVCAVALIILSALTLGALLWFLGEALVKEIKEVIGGSSRLSGIEITDKMAALLDKVKIFGGERFIDVEKMQTSAITKIASVLGDSVASLVKSAPSVLLFLVVTILSLFYFSCDMERVKDQLARLLPEKAMSSLSEWSGIALCAVKRFAKAYLSLFCITLIAVTVGFFIIGIKYPFLGALLCAFVDLLPVFGVGSVLFPWAVFLFFTGETGKAVGMLILLALMYALRQILEPRIVGTVAGVHPIIVLFGVFLGFKLLGVGGLIAAPLSINAAAVFLEEKRKKLGGKVDKREQKHYNYIE